MKSKASPPPGRPGTQDTEKRAGSALPTALLFLMLAAIGALGWFAFQEEASEQPSVRIKQAPSDRS